MTTESLPQRAATEREQVGDEQDDEDDHTDRQDRLQGHVALLR